MAPAPQHAFHRTPAQRLMLHAPNPLVRAVLRSPAMDFSGETTVILEFKYDFRWYMYGLNEVADVDVSTNDGTTWTNVWRRSGADDRGPKTARVDISALAASVLPNDV